MKKRGVVDDPFGITVAKQYRSLYENRGRHRVTHPVARKANLTYGSPGPLTSPRIAVYQFTRLRGV